MRRRSVALVTGAGSGIGAATVRRLRRRGVAVVVSDKNGVSAHRVAAEQEPDLAPARGLRCDVTEAAELEAAVAAAESLGDSLDVLVCSAGFPGESRRLERIAPADWDEIHRINTVGVAHAMGLVLPGMRARGSGAVVAIASIAGITGSGGQVAYSAAKAAVIGMTRAAAKEVRRSGVRVNAVAPGFIDTPMTQAMTPELKQAWGIDRLALEGRLGRADEVAAVVDFLCGAESTYLTGAVVPVDGGFTLGAP